MTDTSGANGSNGGATAEGEATSFSASVVAQYIKDLSFENPQVDRLFSGEQAKLMPSDVDLRIEFNVGARRAKPELFEVTIELNASAHDKAASKPVYQLELTYGGLFRLQNIPDEALEPFLLINCPSLLFPFVRRIAADMTREGGYEPLLLDPIDFAQLYVARKQQGDVASATPSS